MIPGREIDCFVYTEVPKYTNLGLCPAHIFNLLHRKVPGWTTTVPVPGSLYSPAAMRGDTETIARTASFRSYQNISRQFQRGPSTAHPRSMAN